MWSTITNTLYGFFHPVLIQPLFNLLIVIYIVFPIKDLGIAIILMTLFVRAVTYPLSQKVAVSQKKLSLLQPQIKEIEKKYAHDNEVKTKAMMNFYKENDANPFSGCFPTIIQLVLFIGLYYMLQESMAPQNTFGDLYSFIPAPTTLNTNFLGIIDITHSNKVLAILVGVATYLQSKVTFNQKKHIGAQETKSSEPDIQKIIGMQMVYFLPIFIGFIAWTLPAGLSLYWITTTLFSFIQQYSINKRFNVGLGA
ncbi:MAG: YidC/Oxa1 family membrane protein insertase [Candidatus Spechtbacteria bacterium]|nr:YidC/Oxa1 family membrane protein insertase [Candidatus Spechtbacteria bacterium]